MTQGEQCAPHGAESRAANERLKAALYRMTNADGKIATTIGGLHLTRWSDTSRADTCFYAPAVGLIVQGRKRSVIGSTTFTYGELDCLVNGVDMPSASTIVEATPEKPLFAVSLAIDRSIAMELAAKIPPPSGAPAPLGVCVAPVTFRVLDAFVRLVELLDKPEQIALRAPLLVRELTTHVLIGPQGASLRKVFAPGSHSSQIAEAVTRLRAGYTEHLRVERLAEQVGMATSTFHRQFKKITSLSPLQFQKCLRLYEAQRLMLAGGMDANSAGRAVGYDNIQQFNREYKRMFGEPPLRDIKRLRRE